MDQRKFELLLFIEKCLLEPFCFDPILKQNRGITQFVVSATTSWQEHQQQDIMKFFCSSQHFG